METFSVATAAFHTICKNRKPSQTSDANPRNPTAPSCPVRRKLWEPHVLIDEFKKLHIGKQKKYRDWVDE